MLKIKLLFVWHKSFKLSFHKLGTFKTSKTQFRKTFAKTKSLEQLCKSILRKVLTSDLIFEKPWTSDNKACDQRKTPTYK